MTELIYKHLFLRATLLVMLAGCAAEAPNTTDHLQEKPRVVVTTDPELDDFNSLLRYLLYSTDFQTEGLIYASSQFHWKGDGTGKTWKVEGREYTRFGLDICPCTSWRWAEDDRFIHEAVETYAEVYDNLIVHNPDYPAPSELLAKIKIGNIEFDGDISKDTPGSDLIKSLLLDNDDTPLYLLAWGGQSTIGRALKSIQEQYAEADNWDAIQLSVSEKAIIQAYGDQDDVYATYIQPNWPDIEFREMANSTYGYGARGSVLPEDLHILSAAWTATNVSSQGPMGARYRVWGDGVQMVKDDIFDYFGLDGYTDEELRAMGYIVWMPVQEKGSWISEGDTPTFMNLINNGLRGYEDASYGGWGGRNSEDVGPNGSDQEYTRARFFGAAQHDFASRLKWSVTSVFEDANHEPVVNLTGPHTITAKPGDTITLQASVSDPDGDTVATRWWQYIEADSYTGEVSIESTDALTATVQIPTDAVPGCNIHLILEATDDGMPALTRYQRVVVTVAL
ncbi:MAG: nucleoside hydrolase-like domain-containing protein [Bacteroidota bacterium]